MPIITSVEPQKKNPHRFNIFLDGQFAFGADEDLVVNQRLLKGKVIAPEDLDKLLLESEVGKLMDRIYNLLSRRGRSEKEIRDYLKNLSFKRKIKDQDQLSEVVIESLITRLKTKDLINDLEFAKAWVETRRRTKKKGQNGLKSELYQKGIAREIIEQIFENAPVGEEQMATKVLEKKLNSLKNHPLMEIRRKCLTYLISRGYDFDLAREVVEKMTKKGYNSEV